MAAKKTNPLELNSNTLKELFKDRGELPTPSFSAGGAGIASTTGGRGTVSQAYQDYLANIDFNKRTPLESALEFGSTFTKSGEDIGRELQQRAKNNIENEVRAMQSSRKTPSTQVDSAKEVDIKPKQNEAKKLYRVMYAGKGAESSEVYKTKEEADAALKKAGGKGAVAGINLSQKTRGGEKLSADEAEARRQAYIDKMAQGKMDKMVYDEQLARAKSPEYKAALQEKGRLANEAKLAKDKEAGAGFASWASNVKTARDVPERQLNEYSKNMSLLNNAYREAIKAGRYLTAKDINEDIKEYSRGVPKEMGARQRYAREGALKNKEREMADYFRRKQEAQEAENRLLMSNPDYQQFNR